MRLLKHIQIILVVTLGLICASLPTFAGDLHVAVQKNDSASIEALLRGGAAINESDLILGTPLHLAVKERNIGIAKMLIDHGADLEAVSELQGERAMHLAAVFGDVPMLQLLLDSGAEIDSRDDYQRTPLFQAANWGHAEAVELLLKKGADTESKDSQYGWTPLIGAAHFGRLEAVKLLVEAGANLEARDLSGRTALREAASRAAWSAVGNPSLIEYLVVKGADINAKEDNGLTILGHAEFRSTGDDYYAEIAEVLHQMGATK